MRTIRSVSVGSAFKVMAVLNALVVGVFGAIGLAIFLLLSVLMAGSGAEGSLGAAGIGVVGSILGYIAMVVSAAIGGGIIGAIYALIYNLVAGITGGIQIELE